jgi:hypothetical protein
MAAAPLRRPPALVAALAFLGALAACVEPSRPTLRVDEGADSVQVIAGDGQVAYVQRPVAIPPTVVVKDVDGFRMPGVRVRFVATPGNGTVTDGEQVTDSLGRATVGSWIVGDEGGRDTLVAFVIGGAGASATRATIVADVIDPCVADVRPYAIGTTVTDVVADPACLTDADGLANAYEVTLTAPTLVRAQVTTDSLRPYLDIAGVTDTIVALAEDQGDSAGVLYVPLPTGTWRLRAGTSVRDASTGYTLQSAVVPDLPGGCLRTAFLVRGSQVASSVGAADCGLNVQVTGVYNGASSADRYFLVVPDTRTTWTVRATVGGADAILLLATADGSLLTIDDNSGGGTNPTLRFRLADLRTRPGVYLLFIALKGTPATPVGYTIAVDR